jgi:hypothetical protein
LIYSGWSTIAALMSGPGPDSSGGEPERVGGAEHQPEAGRGEGAPPDQLSKAEYISKIADIQNRSVEASLNSNDKLLRYDRLTAADIDKLDANRATLEEYGERVEGLDPPDGYEDQYRAFVLAIDELRDANGLAYRLAADPASATQTNFEAYDRYISRATSHLLRSNEILGRDYKTPEAAQEVSFG